MVNFQISTQSSKIGGAIVFVFYGIYLSFNFVPGLIGFLRIAKRKTALPVKSPSILRSYGHLSQLASGWQWQSIPF